MKTWKNTIKPKKIIDEEKILKELAEYDTKPNNSNDSEDSEDERPQLSCKLIPIKNKK